MTIVEKPTASDFNWQNISLGDQVFMTEDLKLCNIPKYIVVAVSEDGSTLRIKPVVKYADIDDDIQSVSVWAMTVCNRADISRPPRPIQPYTNHKDIIPEVHDLVCHRGSLCVVDYTPSLLRYEGILQLKSLTNNESYTRIGDDHLQLIYSPTKDEKATILISALSTRVPELEEDYSDGPYANALCTLLPEAQASVKIIEPLGHDYKVDFKTSDVRDVLVPRCYLTGFTK